MASITKSQFTKGSKGSNLDTGTEAEATGETAYCLAQFLFLQTPESPAGVEGDPQLVEPFYINHKSINCPTDLTAGQCDGGHFLD